MTTCTDTVANVLLEVGARGLPAVASGSGGPHGGTPPGATGRVRRAGEPGDPAVTAVLADLVRRPRHHLVARWNWKAALMSGVVRGLLFLAVTRSSGPEAAGAALAVEFAYRIASTGCWAALTQAFRRATPGWAAGLVVMVAIPAAAHVFELGVHRLAGTAELGRAMAASIALTIVSAAFTLFAMRRGVLIVADDDQQSLRRDVGALPRLVARFLIAVPTAAWRFAVRAGGVRRVRGLA